MVDEIQEIQLLTMSTPASMVEDLLGDILAECFENFSDWRPDNVRFEAPPLRYEMMISWFIWFYRDNQSYCSLTYTYSEASEYFWKEDEGSNQTTPAPRRPTETSTSNNRAGPLGTKAGVSKRNESD